MKSIIILFTIIVLSESRAHYFLVGGTQSGIFQQYNRDQCYYTNQEGVKSFIPTYDDYTREVIFKKFATDDCEGEFVSEVVQGFNLKNKIKKRVGFQSVVDDDKCSHKRYSDGKYYAPSCYGNEYVGYHKYEENDEEWDHWLVLNHYGLDDTCTKFQSQERLFECEKCTNGKWGTCGTSSLLVLSVVLILLFIF